MFGRADAGCCYASGWDAKRTLVNLAIDHGWQPAERVFLLLAACWASPDDHCAWEALEGVADDALDYLNSITDPAYRWDWDRGELVLAHCRQWKEWGSNG